MMPAHSASAETENKNFSLLKGFFTSISTSKKDGSGCEDDIIAQFLVQFE